MLGKNGVKLPGSRTAGQSDKTGTYFRIDVENPDPGGRPGQMHLQDNKGHKYLYNFFTNKFDGAPNGYLKKISKDPDFNKGITKGTNWLGVK